MSRRRAAKDNHSVVPQMESASASPADTMGMYGNTATGAVMPMGNLFASAHEGMSVSQMGQLGQAYGAYEAKAGVEATEAPAARSRQNRKAQAQTKGQRKQQGAKRKANESDEEDGFSEDEEEMGTVPVGQTAADIAKNKYNHIEDEKERKRLKRLLRNRVSAQQARERKKAYMSTLESRSKETEQRVLVLEQQVNKLERENFMLRQVVKSTTKESDYGEM